VVATLYLASFLSLSSNYSLAFVTKFPSVKWQKTLFGWGRYFLTKIVSDNWLDGPFVEGIAGELRRADGSTGLAE